MQYLLNEDFFKHTMFVIASPQEALGMAILAKDHIVEYCVIVNYIDYTTSVQPEIIRRIIKCTNIRNVFSLDLYLPNISLNKGERFECWRQIQFNVKKIDKFNEKYFNGQLFSGNYNFVVNSISPFLSLKKCGKKCIFIMEHAPADSVSRLERKLFRQEGNRENRPKDMKRIFTWMKHWDSIIFNLILNRLYPQFSSMGEIEKGFTWVEKPDDTYMFIDPREYPLNIRFSNLREKLSGTTKTLLLITSTPKAFKDFPSELRKEGEAIDAVDMYVEIAKKSINTKEIIVFKLHPFLSEVMSHWEIEEFAEMLTNSLMANGYENVINFESFFDDSFEAKMPVEIFLYPLNIRKIVGDFSSTMEIVQHWGDIEIFSDLRFMRFDELSRERRRRILGGKYHIVT